MKSVYGKTWILGGHKLATSYFSKLLNAHAQNHFTCAQMACVTDDLSAPIYTSTAAKNVIPLSNAEFLLQYAFAHKPDPQDILVPDHTAKHVLLQAYLQLAKQLLPTATVALYPIVDWPLTTPFVYKAENDAILAMSYATWTCPADCAEPQVCPHTQKTRDWDFNAAMPSVYGKLQKQNVMSYDFACQPLHAEISFIPMIYIHEQFLDFQKRLIALGSTQKFTITTHSHCHGIVGAFEVTKGK